MANEVKKDIEAAKIEKKIEIEMVDGKISAEFRVNDNSSMVNGMTDYKYVNYEKIFDDFESFNSYAELFFKEVL